MRPNWLFRGVYLLLVGGFLTVIHTFLYWTRHGASTEQGQAQVLDVLFPGGPLLGYGILVLGVVVAV